MRVLNMGSIQTVLGVPLASVKEEIVEWRDGAPRPAAWPQDVPKPDESGTVTIFTFTTSYGGSLVIRWLGESNGYYSESVSFVETTRGLSR